MEIIAYWKYILSAVLILVPLILIIIEVLERLRAKKVVEKNSPSLIEYLLKIEELNKLDPQMALEEIDNISRQFFRKSLKMENFKTYDDLKKKFIEQNLSTEAKFCELMNEYLFSKNKSTAEQNKKLLKMLREIIVKKMGGPEFKNPSETKKESFLDKIKIPGINKEKLDDKDKQGEQQQVQGKIN